MAIRRLFNRKDSKQLRFAESYNKNLTNLFIQTILSSIIPERPDELKVAVGVTVEDSKSSPICSSVEVCVESLFSSNDGEIEAEIVLLSTCLY